MPCASAACCVYSNPCTTVPATQNATSVQKPMGAAMQQMNKNKPVMDREAPVTDHEALYNTTSLHLCSFAHASVEVLRTTTETLFRAHATLHFLACLRPQSPARLQRLVTVYNSTARTRVFDGSSACRRLVPSDPVACRTGLRAHVKDRALEQLRFSFGRAS